MLTTCSVRSVRRNGASDRDSLAIGVSYTEFGSVGERCDIPPI